MPLWESWLEGECFVICLVCKLTDLSSFCTSGSTWGDSFWSYYYSRAWGVRVVVRSKPVAAVVSMIVIDDWAWADVAHWFFVVVIIVAVVVGTVVVATVVTVIVGVIVCAA